ncbi:MAG: amidohydrolase family protein [Lentisphaeria bacterium]|nr:amidohydrolase family protein [Lentisphaeria bacterium]
MKIIDVHNHPDWHGHNLDAFLANMDQYNIDKTWILSWECRKSDYNPSYAHVIPAEVLGSSTGPIPFSRCVSYVERAPERFILGYCPDPLDPDACQKLQAANKIYGANVCGELKSRTMYDSPDCLRLFRLAAELKMPVTFHLQYDMQPTIHEPWEEWWGGTIDTLERTLQACPDTIFLGHAPGFWIHISGDDQWKTSNYPIPDSPVLPGGRLPELLRKYPNLMCDISAGSGCRALSRDPGFAKKFLLEFQDRICYARDYFDNIHQEFLNSLDLPEKVLAKIYAENSERLLEDYR